MGKHTNPRVNRILTEWQTHTHQKNVYREQAESEMENCRETVWEEEDEKSDKAEKRETVNDRPRGKTEWESQRDSLMR